MYNLHVKNYCYQFYQFKPLKIKILKNPFLVDGEIIIYPQNFKSICLISLALH